MRKSIYLTLLFALFISASAYAQCTEDENNPAAGVPHTYKVAISGPEYNGDGVYQWYVTQTAGNLMSGTMSVGTYFNVDEGTTSDEFSAYNSTAANPTTTDELSLTWTTDAIVNGNPYFLVLNYSEENLKCKAMNMKVMKIEPLNKFMLNINPVIDETGAAFGNNESATVCAADVDGASYDATEDKVTYTYGENTLYYKVTASGFVGDWKPQIRLPELGDAGQKYVSAEWAVEGSTDWNEFTDLTQSSTSQDLTSTALAAIPTSAPGSTPSETYIYKIVIDNERYENLDNQTLTVATDGTYGGTDNNSLVDKTDDCSADEAQFGDDDAYTIKARPTVVASSGEFIQEIH